MNKIIIQLAIILVSFVSFSQEIKPKCLDGNCKNKIGTFLYSDSSIYVGSFVDKLRSGQGKITYKNKSSYDGQWLNDKRNGYGVYVDSLGNVYEGNWVDDLKSGKGKFIDVKGNVYDGSWTNNELTGQIIIRYKNKSLYEGEYNQGIRGQGKFTYSDGSVYSGNFAKNKRSGYGEMVYIFGLTYKGNWVSNEVDGQGQFYLTAGQVKIAEGTWKTDKTNPSDSKFISSDGLMVCFYANKNLYYGKVQDGIPSGAGIMKYAIGDVYEGNFEKGIYNGNGRLKLKDNSEYTGEWKNGEKDGFGTLTKADKLINQGYWKRDIYLGVELSNKTIKMILEPASCENEEYDDVQQKGTCVNGLKEGQWQYVNEDGTLFATFNYNQGVKNGDFKMFNSDGKVSEKGTYKDGLLEGYTFRYTSNQYAKNGLLCEKIKYTHGIIDSAYLYNVRWEGFSTKEYYLSWIIIGDTSPSLLKEEAFVYNNWTELKDQTKTIHFYPNGKIKQQYNDGLLTEYDELGNQITQMDKAQGTGWEIVKSDKITWGKVNGETEIVDSYEISVKRIHSNGFIVEVIEDGKSVWKGFKLPIKNKQEYIVNGNTSTLKIYSEDESYEEDYDEGLSPKPELIRTINFRNNVIESDIYENKLESLKIIKTFKNGKIDSFQEGDLKFKITYPDKEFKNEFYRQTVIGYFFRLNSFKLSIDFDNVKDFSSFLSYMNGGQFIINAEAFINGKQYTINKYILKNNLVDSVYLDKKLIKVSNVDIENFKCEKGFYTSGKIKYIASFQEYALKHYDGYNRELMHQLNGELKIFHENGSVHLSGLFKDNKLVGKLTYTPPNGMTLILTLEELYKLNDENLKELLEQISTDLW